MEKTQRLVDKVTPLLHETMGEQTATLFYTFYEKEDDNDVMEGARSLLYEFMGREMTEKRLRSLRGNHEK